MEVTQVRKDMFGPEIMGAIERLVEEIVRMTGAGYLTDDFSLEVKPYAMLRRQIGLIEVAAPYVTGVKRFAKSVAHELFHLTDHGKALRVDRSSPIWRNPTEIAVELKARDLVTSGDTRLTVAMLDLVRLMARRKAEQDEVLKDHGLCGKR